MSAYLKFFQLEKSPFDTRAQSALVLGTKALRTAFAEIEAGLADGASRICVDGKAGLGKTSLARALPKLLGETTRVVLILNPSLPWSTLRSAIVKQLDLAEGNLSRKTLMRARNEGRKLVIAVDQAERISSESLDHLDILLGYKNDDDEQLMHCVLLANLEAAASQHNEQGEQTPLLWWLDKLNTLQLEFQPIPSTGVTSYVQKHLKRAGWKGGQIFTPDALQTIHRLTGGVPRAMSDLCERALELAAEEETGHIDAGLVEDVFGEIPLEELVDDEDDITDSRFVGAKDDHASSNTTTFGGGARASEPDAPVFESRAREAGASTLGAPSDESSAGAFGAASTTSAPGAETTTPGSSRDDDPRIDRMPSPGRTVHAPVEAPISLDSFFGDSLSGGPARKPVAEPDREPAREVAAEPSFDTPSSIDETVEAPRRVGFARWAGIAAGALLIVGGGGYAALSMLGGDELAGTSEPPILARPKPEPVTSPAPIAGIETGELHISPSIAAEVVAREALEPNDTEATMGEGIGHPTLEGSDTAGAARAPTSAEGATAPDPLLGLDLLDAAPPTTEMATPSPAPSATGVASAEVGTSDSAASPTSGAPPEATAAAATTEPVPAAPAAPGWENPADVEVDAPFW